MALINDIHNIINFATDKGVTGYHKPEDIDNEIHAVSTDLWQKFYDQYAITKKISSYMAPFEVKDGALTLTGTGATSMTKEIEHPTLVLDNEDREVKMRERFQWGREIKDTISPPTVEYPICIFASRTGNVYNIEVLPVDVSSITVYGLRKPLKPNWTSTIGTDGRRVFNDQDPDFQDIEWSELLFNDIRNRVLTVMGINLRERDIAQFSEMMKSNTE